MGRYVVRAFGEGDLEGAALLLAGRHREHRRRHPLLPASYEDPEQALGEVKAAWESDGASGAVAVDGERVVGYLLGAPKTSPLWGPNLWIENAGHAVLEAEVVRDLYAAAANKWVEDGRTAHYVLVPDEPELIDAWFRLGFGSQHAHALRPVPAEPLPARPGLTIRRAERDDITALAELELVLPQHLGLAPVFSAGKVLSLDEAVAEWEKSFDDPAYTTFVAEDNGQVIGSAVGCPLTKGSAHLGLNRADNAAFLGFAAVWPEARGRGAGRALGEAVLNWSAEAGYAAIATDWRVTNLLAARTWPRLGFVQTFHRLHRLVGY